MLYNLDLSQIGDAVELHAYSLKSYTNKTELDALDPDLDGFTRSLLSKIRRSATDGLARF